MRKQDYYDFPWASWNLEEEHNKRDSLINNEHRSLYALSAFVHRTINEILYLPYKQQSIVIPPNMLQGVSEENLSLVLKLPSLIGDREIKNVPFIRTNMNTIKIGYNEKIKRYSEMLVSRGVPQTTINTIIEEILRQKRDILPLGDIKDVDYTKSLQEDCDYLNKYYPAVGSFVTECINSIKTGKPIIIENCIQQLSYLEKNSLEKTGELIIHSFLEAKVKGTPPLQHIPGNGIKISQAQPLASSAISHKGAIMASIFWRCAPISTRIHNALSIYQLASSSYDQDHQLITNLFQKMQKAELEEIIAIQEKSGHLCIIEKLEVITRKVFEDQIGFNTIKDQFNNKLINLQKFNEEKGKYCALQLSYLNEYHVLLTQLVKENKKIPFSYFETISSLYSIIDRNNNYFSFNKHKIESFLINELTKESLYKDNDIDDSLLKIKLLHTVLSSKNKIEKNLPSYKISYCLKKSLNTLINNNLVKNQLIPIYNNIIFDIQHFELKSLLKEEEINDYKKIEEIHKKVLSEIIEIENNFNLFNSKTINDEEFHSKKRELYKSQINDLESCIDHLKKLSKENKKIPIVSFQIAFATYRVIKNYQYSESAERFFFEELTKEDLYPNNDVDYALLKVELLKNMIISSYNIENARSTGHKISHSFTESINYLIKNNLLSIFAIKKLRKDLFKIQLAEIKLFVKNNLQKHTEITSIYQKYMTVFKDSKKFTMYEDPSNLEFALIFSCFILSDKNPEKPEINDNFIANIKMLITRYKEWIDFTLPSEKEINIDVMDFSICLLFISQHIELSKMINTQDLVQMFNASLQWHEENHEKNPNPFSNIKEEPLLTLSKDFDIKVDKKWILDRAKELSQ